jgi:intein/homing endonuclease
MKDLEKIFEKIKHKANVIGYSRKLQPRIRGGKEIPEEKCFRVYVSKKLPIEKLDAKDVIPKSIDGVNIDVVEIGELKALSVDKKQKFRPVIFGVSVGHINITAGTNGFLFVDINENKYFGSNAHVFVDDVSKSPNQIKEKTIVQPGRYDGGTINDKVAEYVWHKQIYPVNTPSNCKLAEVWAGIYNFFSKVFKRKTRLIAIVEEKNHIDFAIAKPVVDYEVKFPDFDYTNHKFVGLGFAGSDTISVVCKAKYIIDEGYFPYNVETELNVKEGDIVMKSGRTSCFTQAKVIDSSAVVSVSYGSFYAVFEDVILTEKLLEPGDSITGDSRMFYLENGNLKFGTVEEIYKSFLNGNQISVLTVKKGKHIGKPKSKYPTFGDAYIDFAKASVIYHGVKPVWRITFRNGKSIEVTKDHSLMTATHGYDTNAFIPATFKELRNVVSVDDYGFDGIELNIPDDYLTLLGLWLADGSYNRKSGKIWGIAISTGNEKGIVAFLEKFKFRPKSKGDYRKHSVELARFIYGLCGDVDCYTKRVPPILFTASKRQIGLFLKGYFSGDGSIHTKGNGHVVVEASSVNRKLLEDIQILLNRLGIRSNIDSGFIHSRLSNNKQYKLIIESSLDIKKFLKYVGFLKEIDTDLYKILSEQPSKRKREKPVSLRGIRSIEYIGEKPVYDFKVNPTELFVANGILCHNSGSSVWI